MPISPSAAHHLGRFFFFSRLSAKFYIRSNPSQGPHHPILPSLHVLQQAGRNRTEARFWAWCQRRQEAAGPGPLQQGIQVGHIHTPPPHTLFASARPSGAKVSSYECGMPESLPPCVTALIGSPANGRMTQDDHREQLAGRHRRASQRRKGRQAKNELAG